MRQREKEKPSGLEDEDHFDEEHSLQDDESFNIVTESNFMLQQFDYQAQHGSRTTRHGLSDTAEKHGYGSFVSHEPYRGSLAIPTVWEWANTFADAVVEFAQDPYRMLTPEEEDEINERLEAKPLELKTIRQASIGHNHAAAKLSLGLGTADNPLRTWKTLVIDYALHGMPKLALGALSAVTMAAAEAKITVNFFGNTAAMRANAVSHINGLKRKTLKAVDGGEGLMKCDMVLAPKTLGHLLRFHTMEELSACGFVLGSYFDPILAAEVATNEPLGPVRTSGFLPKACGKSGDLWPHMRIEDLITGDKFDDPIVLPSQLHANSTMCTAAYTLVEVIKTMSVRWKPKDYFITPMSKSLRFVVVDKLGGALPDLNLLLDVKVTPDKWVAFDYKDINGPLALKKAEIFYVNPGTYHAGKEDGVGGIFSMRDNAISGQLGHPGSDPSTMVNYTNGVKPTEYDGITVQVQTEYRDGLHIPLEITRIFRNGMPLNMTWYSRQALYQEMLERWKPVFTVSDGLLVSNIAECLKMPSYKEGVIFNPGFMIKSCHMISPGGGGDPVPVGVGRHVKQTPTLDISGLTGTVEVDADMQILRERPGKAPNGQLRVEHVVYGASILEVMLHCLTYSSARAMNFKMPPPKVYDGPDKVYNPWKGELDDPAKEFDPVTLMESIAAANCANSGLYHDGCLFE